MARRWWAVVIGAGLLGCVASVEEAPSVRSDVRLPSDEGTLLYDRPIAGAPERLQRIWAIHQRALETRPPPPPVRWSEGLSEGDRDRWDAWVEAEILPRWSAESDEDAEVLAGVDEAYDRAEDELFARAVLTRWMAFEARILTDAGIAPAVGGCSSDLRDVLGRYARAGVEEAEACARVAARLGEAANDVAAYCREHERRLSSLLAQAEESVCEVAVD